MTPAPSLQDYSVFSHDKLRYGDTDRQGHVNNAVFVTFLETGRVEILIDERRGLLQPGAEFVIARLELDYRAEMQWPGTVSVGTRVALIGRSSATFEQAIFQDGRCCALAESVIVQIDRKTRKSHPWSEQQIAALEALQ
jgi:acyl-CoA thioester hydrolase